jgi:5-methylcytosine-specific restriction endonuclease McrA
MTTKKSTIKRAMFGGRSRVECHYCQCMLTFSQATLDHVLPKSMGGTFAIRNLVLACLSCNQKRGDAPYERFSNGKTVWQRIEAELDEADKRLTP